jgi:hypothetical protein
MGLFGPQSWGFAFLESVTWATDSMGRICFRNVSGHKPIDSMRKRGQVLLYGEGGDSSSQLVPQVVDESGDMERLDLSELMNFLVLLRWKAYAGANRSGGSQTLVVPLSSSLIRPSAATHPEKKSSSAFFR